MLTGLEDRAARDILSYDDDEDGISFIHIFMYIIYTYMHIVCDGYTTMRFGLRT